MKGDLENDELGQRCISVVSQFVCFSRFHTENVFRLLTSMWKIAARRGWSPTKVFLLFLSQVSEVLLLLPGACFLVRFVLCDSHDKTVCS